MMAASAPAPATDRVVEAQGYVLLEIRSGRREAVAGRLLSMPGVAEVAAVEGPPDVIVRTAASTDREMVKQTVAAIVAVEDDVIRARCLRFNGEPGRRGFVARSRA